MRLAKKGSWIFLVQDPRDPSLKAVLTVGCKYKVVDGNKDVVLIYGPDGHSYVLSWDMFSLTPLSPLAQAVRDYVASEIGP